MVEVGGGWQKSLIPCDPSQPRARTLCRLDADTGKRKRADGEQMRCLDVQPPETRVRGARGGRKRFLGGR